MLSRGGTRWLGVWLIVSLVGERPAIAAASEPAPISATPATPAEDPNMAAAEALFERGSEAYNLGRFTAAIEHFERAYELTQASALLYNIAQAHAKRYEVDADPADLRRAKVMFLNFARISEVTGEDPRDARQRVVQLDAQLAAHETRQAEIRAEEARVAAARVEAERLAAERLRRLAAELRSGPQKLGIAGYALLGVGLTGGVLLGSLGGASFNRLRDQREAESLLPLAPEREALYEQQATKARSLGLSGLVIGVTLLAAGFTMVAADTARRRKALRRLSLRPGGLVVSF